MILSDTIIFRLLLVLPLGYLVLEAFTYRVMFFLFANIINSPSLRGLLIVTAPKEKFRKKEDIITYTQNHWLRKSGQERHDMNENPLYVQHKVFILYHFQKLGMIASTYPKKKYYDYVVLHGAMTETMERRILFWKGIVPGIKFKQIVFLTGRRMLDPIKEKNYKGLTTEAEMAEYLVQKNRIKNVQIINAIEFKGARPNTQDTVNTWIKSNPTPGSVLAISNAPYNPRQDWILKKSLGDNFTVETVGPSLHPKTKLSTLFDELARLIFTENT